MCGNGILEPDEICDCGLPEVSCGCGLNTEIIVQNYAF